VPVTRQAGRRIGRVAECRLEVDERIPSSFEPFAECFRSCRRQQIGLDRSANFVVASDRRWRGRVDANHVPAMLGPDGADDRADPSVEDLLAERPGELQARNPTEVAAMHRAASVDRKRVRERDHFIAARQPPHDIDGGWFIGHDDLSRETHLRPAVEVRVPLVIRANVVLRDRDAFRHDADQPGNCSVSQAAEAAGSQLVCDDLLEDDFARDPATGVLGSRSAGRQVTRTRTPLEPGQTCLHARRVDGGTGHHADTLVRAKRLGRRRSRPARQSRGRQPFTPPTVIPSTKNRWKSTNVTMIGSTRRVDAAISRLYATSCSLV
jgi:hypothetical protein